VESAGPKVWYKAYPSTQPFCHSEVVQHKTEFSMARNCLHRIHREDVKETRYKGRTENNHLLYNTLTGLV